MIKENFIKIYEESFKENWALPALTDYGKSKTFTFGDVATEIARIHLLFHECQVRRGDKIALIGKDSSRWCIAYMAVVTYGAIIVPILQDFNPNDVHHIINHSESVFCSGVNVSYVSCLWPMPIVALSIYWYPWHSVCMSIY